MKVVQLICNHQASVRFTHGAPFTGLFVLPTFLTAGGNSAREKHCLRQPYKWVGWVDHMNFRQIAIPVTTGHIVLMFKQYQNNGDWVSIASDEAMKDIAVLLGAQSGNE